MKDKLVKTNHGRFYYRAMSILRGVGLTLAAAIVFSAPVVIAYGINAAETKAGEETSTLAEAPSSSSDLEIVAYED